MDAFLMDVFGSVWNVADAVNNCPELAIRFPTDHDEQRAIAGGFCDKSKAGFTCCMGAIDGLLMWTQQLRQSSAK